MRRWFLFSFGLVCISFFFLHFTKQEKKVLNIAVASNFSTTFQKIAKKFENTHKCTIRPSYGATSKLYLQIINDAPFDIFLSADCEHTKMIVEKSMGEPDACCIYAIGQLVFYAPNNNVKDDRDIQKLLSNKTIRVSIANPETAPYGKAAYIFLKQKGIFDKLSPSQLITAENVGQTMTFILTKNADAGFVAKSHVLDTNPNMDGVYEIKGTAGHLPQSAIILKNAKEKDLAMKFMVFLKTDEIQKIIEESGYNRPIHIKEKDHS